MVIQLLNPVFLKQFAQFLTAYLYWNIYSVLLKFSDFKWYGHHANLPSTEVIRGVRKVHRLNSFNCG